MRKVILCCSLFFAAFVSNGQVLLSESFNVSSATSTLPTGWTVSGTGTTTGCNGIDWMQVPGGGFNCTVNGTPMPQPSGQSGSGMAGYNSWDIDAGGISEMVTPSLDFSPLGSYTVSFWVFNQNTSISNAHDSLKVYVNTTATSLGGTLLYANDPNYNTSPAGWAQYTYTVPTTYTGVTNYIIFAAKSNWGQDIFIDDVEVDHVPPTACSGTPLTPSITTATITAPLCTGSTQTMTAVDPNLPTISGITYQWQSAPSATGPWTDVSTGTGATTLVYTTASLSSSTYFRIASTCTGSSMTAYSTEYLVPIGAPQPGIISGSSTFCPGDVSTYSVPNVTGTTYAWTLPAGWSGTSTTNSIQVTPGTTAGSISVTATTICGTSIPQTSAIVPGSAPAGPGTIAGNDHICFGSTQTYSVSPVSGAVSYIWTLPSGWTGSSTTNTITTTANSTPGNITVTAVNGCGQSSVATLAVVIIITLPSPGTITGKDTVCSGTLQLYSIAPVPGATSYVWTLPSGWSGTTTDTSVQVFAGGGNGTLSVTAYVACASSSAAKPIHVVATVNPSVTLALPPAILCQGAPVTITAASSDPGTAPSYQWMVNRVNVVGFGNTYTTSSLATGDTITVEMTSNAVCAANPVVVSNDLITTITPAVVPGVSISTVPPIIICKGTPITFSTTSVGTGVTPTYQWYKNRVPIPGAIGTTYTDAGLNNADTLTIHLTTSAVCATMPEVTSNKVGVTVNNMLVPTVSVTVSPTDVVVPGQPLTFTAMQTNGGITPDYQWQKNGVNIPYGTGDTYTSSTLMPGDHIAVRMLSYEVCASPQLVRSNEIVLKNYTVGIAGAGSWDGSVKLYPNPTSGRFTIAASWGALHSGSQVRVEVLSSIGQLVHRVELIPSSTKWQTEVVLPAGVANGRYMLRISTGDGMRTTLPFVLNR